MPYQDVTHTYTPSGWLNWEIYSGPVVSVQSWGEDAFVYLWQQHVGSGAQALLGKIMQISRIKKGTGPVFLCGKKKQCNTMSSVLTKQKPDRRLIDLKLGELWKQVTAVGSAYYLNGYVPLLDTLLPPRARCLLYIWNTYFYKKRWKALLASLVRGRSTPFRIPVSLTR